MYTVTYVLPAIHNKARSAQANYFTALLLHISGFNFASRSPALHSASLSLADSSERPISESLVVSSERAPAPLSSSGSNSSPFVFRAFVVFPLGRASASPSCSGSNSSSFVLRAFVVFPLAMLYIISAVPRWRVVDTLCIHAVKKTASLDLSSQGSATLLNWCLTVESIAHVSGPAAPCVSKTAPRAC